MPGKLAITCGDPAGVGPEIIAAWLVAHPAEAGAVTVIGPALWLATLGATGEKIPVGMEEFQATPGQPNGEGALVAWAAMERAAQGCEAGEFSGVVTGPVSKAELARIGYPFPGQTEFFAARWGGDPVMAFCGGKLRVVLATWHVPLHEVARQLGPDLLHRTVAAAPWPGPRASPHRASECADSIPMRARAACWATRNAICSTRRWPTCGPSFPACRPACRGTRFSPGRCAASSMSSWPSFTTRASRR